MDRSLSRLVSYAKFRLVTGQEDVALVADRLHSFSIRFLRLVREEDKAAGVGPAQLSAMSVLAFRDGLTLGELAQIEHVSLPTMSRTVAALHRAGLVARSTNPDDLRSVCLSLTARGRGLFDTARARRLRVASKIVASLDATERAQLLPIIEKLAGTVSRTRRP
jgi:DNA-binding MarR family transcriptional regulator